MSKSFFENLLPAAMLAAPVLAPGTAGVAGSGLLGATPAASLPYGAFGSANMAAQMAGPALLPEAAAGIAAGTNAALPAMSDDLIVNGLWDGVGKIPNQIESAGLDFINGVPQNFGAGVEQFANNLFDGGFKMPSFGQPQQQQNRPAAITNQVKQVGRMAQNTEAEYGYSQPPIGETLTPEEIWKLRQQRGY